MPDDRVDRIADVAMAHFHAIGAELADENDCLSVLDFAHVLVAMVLSYLIWAFEEKGEGAVREGLWAFRDLLDQGVEGIYDEEDMLEN